MRFVQTTIAGFAGIARQVELDLDAGVVVLLGANGFGKSTICDALGWALTGRHPRGADPRSLYGSGETFVEVKLRSDAGEVISVRRVVSNPDEESHRKLLTTLVVQQGEERRRGSDAEAWLVERLLGAGAGQESFTTDSFYLQQDSLRDFLTSRSDDERFAALSQMVGARSLSEFVQAFDSALRAWGKAVRQEMADVEALESTLNNVRIEMSGLEVQLERMSTSHSAALSSWWRRANTERNHEEAPSEPQLVDLEAAAEDLRIQAATEKSRRTRLGQLHRELYAVRTAPVEEAPPRLDESDLASQSELVEASREEVVLAEDQVELARRALETAETRGEELAALAELALRHVGDRCPTCGQDVNADDLTQRLQDLLASARSPVRGEGERLASALQTRATAVQRERAARGRLESLRAAVNARAEYERAIAERQSRQDALELELTEAVSKGAILGQDPGWDESIQNFLDELDQRAARLEQLGNEFELLRPGLGSAATATRLSNLQIRERELQDERDARAELLALRHQTQALAEVTLQGFRRDSEAFLNERLRSIQPIMDQLYAAIDPHPTLRTLRLETRNWYGKNRLSPVLTDSMHQVSVDDPGRTLSTSQANALAVTLFLAFNLGLTPTRLGAVILDDPLQNLDSVHLLGLVDLMRRVQEHRQVIVTTHDEAFADLLCRKMRPLDAEDRLTLIAIEAWDREGPDVSQQISAVDPQPMKLVATG